MGSGFWPSHSASCCSESLWGSFWFWRKSVRWEEMETTHGELTGPSAGGAGWPGRTRSMQDTPWQLHHTEHRRYPTNQSLQPALCMDSQKDEERYNYSHLCVLGSTVLTNRRRGRLLLRLRSVVSHPCSPESERSPWACWYLISFPITQQPSQSRLAKGLKFGSKLFAPHPASSLKNHILIEEVYEKYKISWTTEKFKSSLFWKIKESLMAT